MKRAAAQTEPDTSHSVIIRLFRFAFRRYLISTGTPSYLADARSVFFTSRFPLFRTEKRRLTMFFNLRTSLSIASRISSNSSRVKEENDFSPSPLSFCSYVLIFLVLISPGRGSYMRMERAASTRAAK